MKIAADLHCHTLASGHAYSTVDEVVRAAADAGLEAVAITDHGPNLQSVPSWYFTNMQVFPRKVYGVELLRGIEANIIDDKGSLDVDEKTLDRMDYVVASMHTVTIFGSDAEYFTSACLNAMKNPYICTIGHPDDDRMPVHYAELVQAAAETGTLLEVNNHSLSQLTPRPGAKANLIKMLKLCKKQDVPVVVTSDAHIAYAVGKFNNSLELLKELEFPKELVANTSVDKLKLLIERKKQSLQPSPFRSAFE